MMVFLYPMMVFLSLYDGLPLSIIMMVFLYPMDISYDGLPLSYDGLPLSI